jgi:hypothetical protein
MFVLAIDNRRGDEIDAFGSLAGGFAGLAHCPTMSLNRAAAKSSEGENYHAPRSAGVGRTSRRGSPRQFRFRSCPATLCLRWIQRGNSIRGLIESAAEKLQALDPTG